METNVEDCNCKPACAVESTEEVPLTTEKAISENNEVIPKDSSQGNEENRNDAEKDDNVDLSLRITRRRSRKRLHEDELVKCPVCSTSLKKTELTDHIDTELHRLDRVSKIAAKSALAFHSSGKKRCSKQTRSSDQPSHHDRYQTYLRIRYNREKRKVAEEKRAEEQTNCPVCSRCISGSVEELSRHVNKCLNGEADEDDVDIEGEEEEEYEEYTWGDQTRIRATSLLEGGLADLGNVSIRKTTDEDTESDLDVDGDSSRVFGSGQYDESDLLRCPSEEGIEEDKNRAFICQALLEGKSKPPSESDDLNEAEAASASEVTSDPVWEASQPGTSNSSPSCKAGSESQSVIGSLKAKIKELQALVNAENRMRCLICMESYKKPLVSVQCWHVYCEDCWLRTLGAKKLCPQCNMITSPGDLRRIYL